MRHAKVRLGNAGEQRHSVVSSSWVWCGKAGMKTETEVVAELKRIATANGGILKPIAVVEAARSPDSPLHSRFQWDDTMAAHQWRLEQARQLIRVTVTLIGGTGDTPERVWVSLREDQYQKEGGYRFLADVLSDDVLREQLLAEAKDDMDRFASKYAHLKELAEVFDAMAKVGSKRARKPR